MHLNAKTVGFVGGSALCGFILLMGPAENLSMPAVRCGAVAVLMAIWWITEAIPLPATALLPLILFPLLNILPLDEAVAPFANPIIYLFLGGFLMAAAIQRWGLHRRFALTVIVLIGSSPRRIVLGFLVASAAISMWVSNTTATILMISIALSVPALLAEGERPPPAGLTPAIGLSVAYGATVGGMSTIVGTPPNAFLVAFIREQYGVQIGFGQWMLVGVPVMLAGLCVVYGVLLWHYPLKGPASERSRDQILEELRRMGRLSYPEMIVLAVFAAVGIAWITAPFIRTVLPGLSDTSIGLIGALVLFVVPSGDGTAKSVLTWEDAEQLPWGVLLIFGGGLSLAGAIQQTGLAQYGGTYLQGISGFATLFVVIAIASLILLATELMSNIAAAATFMPIVAVIASTRGDSPLLLTVPVALAASCAFMLPVGTPPNAIVFGSKMVTQAEMIRTGTALNLIFLFLVTLLPYLLLPLVFAP